MAHDARLAIIHMQVLKRQHRLCLGNGLSLAVNQIQRTSEPRAVCAGFAMHQKGLLDRVKKIQEGQKLFWIRRVAGIQIERMHRDAVISAIVFLKQIGHRTSATTQVEDGFHT